MTSQSAATVGRRGFLKALLGLTGAALPMTTNAAPRRILIQNSPLAGFQYHAGEALWPSLRVGQTLTLVREADNRYDRNAVRIDWRVRKLGYLPRGENTAVSQMMDRGERLTARIVALGEGSWPWDRVKLAVYLEARL